MRTGHSNLAYWLVLEIWLNSSWTNITPSTSSLSQKQHFPAFTHGPLNHQVGQYGGKSVFFIEKFDLLNLESGDLLANISANLNFII